MTTRIDQLTATFESVNNQAIALVQRCSDEQWRGPSVEEGRPVAVLAHHIGAVHADFYAMLDAFAAGRTWSPSMMMDDVNASNARHAGEQGAVSKDAVRDLLRTNGAGIVRRLRAIRDEQLDSTAGSFGGNELKVAQVIEYVVIGHAREHVATLEQSLSR